MNKKKKNTSQTADTEKQPNPVKKKKKKKSSLIINFLIGLIFLVGFGLISYPTIADWWNKMHATQVIANYEQEISHLDEEEYTKLLEDAKNFNTALAEKGDQWNLDEETNEWYNRTLSVNGSEIIGSIFIPKIQTNLPIYHGTSEAVLQIAVGHLEGSSLPIGGESSHSVVSGHRGLPSAKLFTDIDQLEEGDYFVFKVLGQSYTYQIDQIKVVLPDQREDLVIEEGKDYATLMTCTPYGINTHRLLIRGHRVGNIDFEDRTRDEAGVLKTVPIGVVIAIAILVIALIWFWIHQRNKKKKNTKKSAEK